MSGSLREANPFGSGHKLGSREGRAVLADGVAFVSSTWTAKPYQHESLVGDPGIDLVVGGIGSGKSTAAAHKLLRWALRHPRRKSGHPTKWLLAGPDFALLRQEQMELVLEAARSLSVPFEATVRRVVYGADPRIYLAHGQTIVCRSGTEPRRMRGHQFDGGWLDEGEQMPEEAFTMAIARQRSAEAVRLIVTTSPQSVRGSWVWPLLSGESEAHNRLVRSVPLRVHRWTSAQNDQNEAEVLAAIEAALEVGSPGLAAQELGGKFLGSEVRMASAVDCSLAFRDELVLASPDLRAASIGIDIGKSHDFSWLTVLGATGVVLAMERFNATTPGVPREGFYPYLEARILKLMDEWHVPVLKVDAAMQGASFAEGLRRAAGSRAKVDGYRTDSPRRKAEAVEALVHAITRAQVRVPRAWRGPDGSLRFVQHVDQLRHELEELEVQQRGGARTFDHPVGGHDDGVVSVALAFQALSSLRRSGRTTAGSPPPPEAAATVASSAGGVARASVAVPRDASSFQSVTGCQCPA